MAILWSFARIPELQALKFSLVLETCSYCGMGFLNCFLLTPFILNLTCPGDDDSDANLSVQYDLLQRLIMGHSM